MSELGAPNATPFLALLSVVVIIFDLGVMAYTISDLYKPERHVRGGNKTARLLIILFLGMLVLGSSALLLSSAFNTPPLLALAPLVGAAIALGVVAYCIVDLYKPERRVRGGNKDIWLLIILFFGVLGWLAYFFIGREV